MNFTVRKKNSFSAWLRVFIVPLALLLIYGCSGSSGYDARPAQTQVLIDAATLNSWVEHGYGTDANGYNKLVILDVDSASSYAGAHIPGSYNLDTGSDLSATRSDGVSFTVSLVPTKDMMDALIQRSGIDAHTVVAFVGTGSLNNVGRAYFNFRYWGFPKERLRVFNGTKKATYVAEYDLTNEPTPDAEPSTYSVSNLTPNVSVRASLEEMIGYAEDDDPFTVIIDARSDGEYDGVNKSTSTTSGNYVAFEGHVRTAEHQEYTTLQQGGKGSNPLLANDELIAKMAAINMDEDGTGISYCRTSWRAATTFLALDAALGWKAKIYDGAWIEWGQMASNDAAIDGSLENDSPWRTDTDNRSEAIKYNRRVVAPVAGANSFAAHANLINETDKAVCGGAGSFPTDRAVEVMIDAATLKAWVAAGVPNDPANGPGDNPYPGDYSKFVMLDVDSSGTYNSGHIPGSFLLNTSSDVSKTRNNGIVNTVSQVADQGQMDAIIQRTGIDADTIVVFYTSSSNFMNLGRAYFNFRYWGFPKEQLRVLDGTSAHWVAAGGAALTNVAPAPVVSAYSVCNLRQDNSVDEVRATYEEMFGVAADDDPDTVIADARSANEYNGVIGSTSVSGPTYVAFEGHARTALHQEYTTLMTNDGVGPELKSDADLVAAMTAIGADASTTVYTYCRTSWRAAVNFLALDAVLGWPVKIYDGAWIEWGQMAPNNSSIDGSLDPASPWLADNAAHTASINYNKTVVVPVGANSYAPHANLINTEDAGTAAAGGGSGAGSGGGSSQPEAPGYK